MTYIHFIVYALCLLQLGTMLRVWVIYERKHPEEPNREERMLSWHAFHESVHDFAKRVEENKKYFDEKVKIEVTKEIQAFIASKYQEYWEKQFFTNKPDTKND